ncbi:MAG: prolyl oligopeptidase family serine peptidase [Planctomycetes bacterium]|nr:prolyl oligopeptidase family serine peptidase [Planctomycetota bacterium]
MTTFGSGKQRTVRSWRIVRAWTVLGLLALCGCPSMESLPTQAPILEAVEGRTQKPYLLYVPSRYTPARTWPLLVLCHGTWPYDTAQLQMREWALFAENQGIVVAAPTLSGAKGDMTPEPAKQIALQQQDEQTILAMVAEVKGRYKIAEEQVFMTGWSAGSYAILHTGLRNPDVFRAIAIRQGSFDKRYMDVPTDRLDRWQPVKVIYGSTDFLRDQTKECIKWLRDEKMFVEEQELPGQHRRIEPKFVWRFFATVTKERPWIRIRARSATGENPLAVQFELRAIPEATKQKWFFGDGGESRDESPLHEYKQPGRYEVVVNVALKGGKKFTRKKVVQLEGPIQAGS